MAGHATPSQAIVALLLLSFASCMLNDNQLFAEPASSESQTAETISFELDIQPILTAHGCNAGACHGKQRGQNGFQLSLLGFDSEFDFQAIVQQARGRRISVTSPQESLLIQKATAALPHGGGQKIVPDSPNYQTLVRWISQGASRRLIDEPVLEKVTVAEDTFSIASGQTAQIAVSAHYSDGSRRDVTKLATYLSNDAAIVSVDELGLAKAGSLPGETAVMARYMNHIKVVRFSIPRSALVPADVYEQLPRANFVDDLIYEKLQSVSIRPSPPASDSVFLRRVFTDVIGRLPTVEETRSYLDSNDPNKKAALIDYVIEQPEYIDYWSNQWADLLRPNPYRVGIKAVLNYDNWIRQQFRDDVSYDEFARRLITAKGSTWQNGAVTLFRDRRSPDEIATLVSQLFLGIRLECAKCHHHPFEKWSQKDFYSFAAFFGRVARKGRGLSPPISGSEEMVFTAKSGDVRHPVSGDVLPPSPLFGSVALDDDDDPREALADWLTSPDNDYFAKVEVNRIWTAMMGRGFVDPVDDLRSTNPPSNPALFDALARVFRESGFDRKELFRSIALSNAYSASSSVNESNVSDRSNYSRHYRHRLRAEVLLDAVASVTETDTSFSAVSPDASPTQIWTHRIDSTFLDTFGRPNENQDPPCERVPDASVTQSLHLMNAEDIEQRIGRDEGRAARLAKSDLDSVAIVEELYLAILSRRPSDQERLYGKTLLDSAGTERRETIEDLMWALLNSPEFIIQN